MELRVYLRLVRRWVWLILLLALALGAVSFVLSSSRPPVYKAETTVAIGRYIDAPNPNTADIQTGINLALTYAQLVTTHDILQGTIDTLNLPLMADDLQKLVSTRTLSGTSLLVIAVTYTDPVKAADIADQLAEQLILKSPTNLTPDQQAQVDFANTQITALNAQLKDSRARLEAIDSQLGTSHDPEIVDRLTQQRDAVVDQINQTSANIAQFSTTVTTIQERTNAIDIVERAQIPLTTSGSGIIVTTLLGVIIGGVIAFSIVVVREYFDDTIHTTEDAIRVLGLPVLGGIERFGKKHDAYPKRLIAGQTGTSAAVDGYHSIRTNLIFNDNAADQAAYIVTSASSAEGKSVTAANLAAAMAHAGLRVLLIDCDMRRPKLHEIFELENKVGLTTLLAIDPGKQPSKPGKIPDALFDCIQTTHISQFAVITSGPIPPNPSELLGSTTLKAWMDIFRQSSKFDVVLMDTPPCLVVPDSSALAAATRADVILVVDCGHTRNVAATTAKRQFASLGIKIRGVVLNSINRREESSYYGYSHSSNHYYASNGTQRKGIRQRMFSKH